MSGKKKQKITKRVVDDAKGEGGRYYIWDSELPGFGLCVQKSGYKSYFLDYVTESGVRRRAKIAIAGEISPDEARRKASSYRLKISSGYDPLEKIVVIPEKINPNFKQVAAEYIEKHAVPFKKESSCANDKMMLDVHILPVFGYQLVKDITRKEVRDFHYSMQEKKYTANRCIQLMSKMMNLCEDWDYRPAGSNPCKGLKKFKEDSKERFLSEYELLRLERALQSFLEKDRDSYFVPLIRLLLLTGARFREVLTCKWSYINFERQVMELPDSKTGKKEIILCNVCVDIIRSLKKVPGNPYLIVSSKNPETHLVNPRKAWDRLLQKANLPGLRIHDLRHTNASIALMANIPLEVIGKRLGHKSLQTTMKYAHLADSSVRQATDVVSNAICKLMRM